MWVERVAIVGKVSFKGVLQLGDKQIWLGDLVFHALELDLSRNKSELEELGWMSLDLIQKKSGPSEMYTMG
eukprot:snap_masked-scaffold_138-processed-gene-0.2-mRNA-1 protein AED:1.00 eAED:1.00 QI:0/0/0/0/1/1/2/0/70